MEKAEAEAVCEYLPEVLTVVETSAKENTNIDSIFFSLASELKVKVHFHTQIKLDKKDFFSKFSKN